MYTVCPGCTRQFQIHAEHLAAASGQVRCGFCHELFNATERLHDEPLSNEKILSSIQLEPELESESELEPELLQELEEEPQFNIPEIEEPRITELEQDVLISSQKNDDGQELETAISEIGIRPSVEEIKAKVKQESVENNEPEPTEKPVLETHYDFPEPEVLREEPIKKRWGWILPLFWSMACLFALLVIASQLVWFNRDRLLLEYPELVPYAKQVCKEIDCRLIRQRDARAIKLINRDVRLHPDYQDALLVNAAMKNELPVRQPYPKVQLTLFDTSGSLLGYREFVPDDYLDSSIEIEKGMPIDSPVYFVLEVSGPTAGAVSFEFRFL
jgi:predicted Zn finger-like uncharacterized protein